MFVRDWLLQQQLPLRCDCPVCFHHNTFSAREENGEVLYKCFHADCKVGGKYELGITLDVLYMSEYNSDRNNTNNESSYYVIPEHFCSPLQNKDSLYFLKRWRLLDKYTKGLELYFDPKQNRVVFPLRNEQGVLKGATGRSLDYRIIPKWYIYNRIDDCPYVCNRQTTTEKLVRDNSVLLVEDCISACTISNLCTSIALLGTNIPIGMFSYLQNCDRIIIALDADATGKAVKLQKELSVIKPTSVIQLRKDLKYYSTLELEELRKWLLENEILD